jgi:hypothetical protein
MISRWRGGVGVGGGGPKLARVWDRVDASPTASRARHSGFREIFVRVGAGGRSTAHLVGLIPRLAPRVWIPPVNLKLLHVRGLGRGRGGGGSRRLLRRAGGHHAREVERPSEPRAARRAPRQGEHFNPFPKRRARVTSVPFPPNASGPGLTRGRRTWRVRTARARDGPKSGSRASIEDRARVDVSFDPPARAATPRC